MTAPVTLRTAESQSFRFNTSAIGEDVFLEVECKAGPSTADMLCVFTVEQARLLANNLLESIRDTEA